MSKIVVGLLGCFLFAGPSDRLSASEFKCGVCNMMIHEDAPNHIILRHEDSKKEPLHLCSLPCVLKAEKYDSHYSKFEFVDFDHRDKKVSGDRAFFLKGSKKIKEQLGDMVMPPYFAAFDSQTQAEAAQKKYGGWVVSGFEKLIRE